MIIVPFVKNVQLSTQSKQTLTMWAQTIRNEQEYAEVARFDNVDLVFDGAGIRLAALHRVSFDVGANEFVSILGPSGCGKTSIIRLIAGVSKPTNGQVFLAPWVSEKNSLGIVFQEPLLLPFRTVFENVKLPLEILGYNAKVISKRVLECLELVNLLGFENHLPTQLSGGMQQRASIARALTSNPSLLLMDEPFSALDSITRETLQMELRKICQETKKTVLFVTHSIDEAVFLSDKVVILSNRPGTVKKVLQIELGPNRNDQTRGSIEFSGYACQVREVLKRQMSKT